MLEDLKVALAAATPGNWSVESEDGRTFITGEGRQLAKILCTHATNAEYSNHVARAKSNARLIALLHNAAPALIECVEVLEELIESVGWPESVRGIQALEKARAALEKLK